MSGLAKVFPCIYSERERGLHGLNLRLSLCSERHRGHLHRLLTGPWTPFWGVLDAVKRKGRRCLAILSMSSLMAMSRKPSNDLKVTLRRKETSTTNVFQQMHQLEEVLPFNASPGHGSACLSSPVSGKPSYEEDNEINRNLGILDSVLAMTTKSSSSSSSSVKGKSKMLNERVNADEEDEYFASSPTKKTKLTASTSTTSNTEKYSCRIWLHCF